ncbi:MAG: tetratricopeptide repeat protein [Candidatus Methylacidiphilales bacterium]|nr:tetratricopeptide repeat protein [Candidatus Methylacidiphilales bacterium]
MKKPAGPDTRSEALPATVPASNPAWTGRAAWAAFFLVLAFCVNWVAVHAFLVDTVTVRLCEKADVGMPEERRMPVFLNEIAFDGYTWNRHAESLGQNGQWRLRHTTFDNAPEGRDVHWNSAFAWYLRGLGEVYRVFHPDTLHNSIYRMSIWANPILLALALLLFSGYAAKRFGPLCGSVIALGMVGVPTFYEGFMPSYPDHHGLIAFTLLGMVFGIAWAGAGWVQGPNGKDYALPRSLDQARHGMILSAVFGAAGLWISALSAATVMATIGVAALTVAYFFGRDTTRENALMRFHPELWKLWAQWGAAGSLFFYALEYFPTDMSMRIEVNHPFYALAWWGGGTNLALLATWLCKPRLEGKTFPWRALILPTLACAILPLWAFGGDARGYALKDPFLWNLHQNIAEFLPLTTRIQLGGLTWSMAFGWFPIFILAALALTGFSSVGRGTKAVAIFLSLPIVLMTGLQFYQTRWGMLIGPIYIALAAIVVPQVWRLVPRTGPPRAIMAVALCWLAFLFVQPTFMNCFAGVWLQFCSGNQIPITPNQGLALLHRQMARAILDDADGKPVVLLSSPNSSCLLSGLGGFRTLGTLYWENGAGLKAAAAGLNSQSDEEALAFMKKHGVTHLSMMTWENFIQPYFRLLYPEPPPGVTFEKSFGKRALFDKVIPVWARPLAFPPNELAARLGQTVLMLKVVPEQSPEEARFHLARFVGISAGQPAQAELILRDLLKQQPGNSTVHLELAQLCLAQNREQEAVAEWTAAFKSADPATKEKLFAELSAQLTSMGKPGLIPQLTTALGKKAPAAK